MAASQKRPRHILPGIVFTQFAGTSLWFAGNAVMGDLTAESGLDPALMGAATSAVQAGFILGTLVFAFLSLSDRYPARFIFFLCAVSGAVFTALIPLLPISAALLVGLRFATGCMLAGIYPVGMKIAAGWYRRSLGSALGYLVGALVLGTAFPHLLKGIGSDLPWRSILWLVAGLAAMGGFVMLVAITDGPYTVRGKQKFDPLCVVKLFKLKHFRAAALGYFGHMWELYAFWAFVPFLIARTSLSEPMFHWMNASVLSFAIIAVGALGCVVGGYAARRWGNAAVAFANLLISALCILISPVLFSLSAPMALLILLIWGFAVVGDSPQFSTLNAQAAPPHLVGSGLTIVNSIGFAITIVSIQLLTRLTSSTDSNLILLVLLVGPLAGLAGMRVLLRAKIQESVPEIPAC